jgi:hypothetical protein
MRRKKPRNRLWEREREINYGRERNYGKEKEEN